MVFLLGKPCRPLLQTFSWWCFKHIYTPPFPPFACFGNHLLLFIINLLFLSCYLIIITLSLAFCRRTAPFLLLGLLVSCPVSFLVSFSLSCFSTGSCSSICSYVLCGPSPRFPLWSLCSCLGSYLCFFFTCLLSFCLRFRLCVILCVVCSCALPLFGAGCPDSPLLDFLCPSLICKPCKDPT